MAAPIDHADQEKNNPSGYLSTIYDHPKFLQMNKYGYEDVGQMTLALHVYLDLTERDNWWNVDIHPCDTLQQVLVCGHPSQTEERQVILAIRKDAQLSVKILQEYIDKVKQVESITGLTIAMVDGDSNTVYYKVSNGLVPPEPPEAMAEKKQRRARKHRRRQARFVHLVDLPQNKPHYPYYVSRPNQTKQSDLVGDPLQGDETDDTQDVSDEDFDDEL